ncbi:hypothetical protein Y032_0001g485 [Ancylostoma ceylanicum]|uniref:Retinal pigment epithelial membrane protein n=1 Tax=Ancylostoma ceylanicum TaxID=53326 RepID=A0A016W6I2_9BILA|nr:hypothetical protein Y032_0001g485 [Ancylostoma ceylanicum]
MASLREVDREYGIVCTREKQRALCSNVGGNPFSRTEESPPRAFGHSLPPQPSSEPSLTTDQLLEEQLHLAPARFFCELKMIAPALLLLPTILCQSFRNVHLGFPDAWDGDKYRELYCPSKNIPKFLDGFFLCQLSASYGKSSAPPGNKLTHMIDAIGAVGAFHISNGQVVFSSQYYPSQPYKIWEFYDRNITKSGVPWAGWSDYNLTAMSRWEQIPPNPDSARFHPNLDFWRVGNRILAGTEAPYWIGYEFDVRTLSKFKLFKFTEENDVFSTPRPTMIPISMAIHERNDPDGTIWGSFSAMNFEEQRFFQGVFTVDSKGVRRVVGLYDYGVWDPKACGKNDEYIGDKTLLPGYIHSITSTETYVVIPITSLLINPCKFKEPPLSNARSSIQKGGLWGMDFYDMVPLRFLIFNKKTKQFAMEQPLEVFPSMFITHQLNAYDSPDGNIVADMVVYDSHDPYVKYFYVDFLTSQLYPSTARILRFTLDPKQQRVMYNYLLPQETIAADFPQINHKFEQKPYQWAYIVEHPFASENRIIKINVDEPAGSRNQKYNADANVVLHEPWFVAKPDARKEDDGVLLVRALDVHENKALLLVIDAGTMKEIGRAFVPISIPFGFHNRFFSKQDLGLPEGFAVGPGNSQFRPAEKKQGFVQLPLRKFTSVLPSTTARTESSPTPSTTRTTRMSSTTTHIPVTTTTRGIPVTVTTQAWSPTTTLPTTTTTAPTTPFTTPKIPRWWPLAATTFESPWWQRVQQGESTATPVFSIPRNIVGKPELSSNSVTFTNKTSTSTADDIYAETLTTLCSWIPKVFAGISSDNCLQQGKKAAKWMAPLASSYAERFRIGKASRALPPTDTAVTPVLRAHRSSTSGQDLLGRPAPAL